MLDLDKAGAARALGWELATYEAAEAGRFSLSAGQAVDVDNALMRAVRQSEPADVHLLVSGAGGDSPACAPELPAGDSIVDGAHVPRVTCGRCKMTFAYHAAVERAGGGGLGGMS